MLQRIQLLPPGAESRSSFELKRKEMDCGGECDAMDQKLGYYNAWTETVPIGHGVWVP